MDPCAILTRHHPLRSEDHAIIILLRFRQSLQNLSDLLIRISLRRLRAPALEYLIRVMAAMMVMMVMAVLMIVGMIDHRSVLIRLMLLMLMIVMFVFLFLFLMIVVMMFVLMLLMIVVMMFVLMLSS